MTRRITAADVGLARPHKYGARRALACRTCGIVVDKHDDGERVREWHTMGHPDQDCTGELIEFDSLGEARTFIALAQAERAETGGAVELVQHGPDGSMRAAFFVCMSHLDKNMSHSEQYLPFIGKMIPPVGPMSHMG